MHNTIWLYEIILFIYGLSLTGYVVDLVKKNGRIKQLAYWMLSLAWLLQTSVLVYETIQTGALPILTLVDVLYVYAWILLTLTLVVYRMFEIQFVELCTNLFAFISLLIAIGLDIKQQGMIQSVHFIHEVLIAHITFTVLAYVFFTLSFFLSIMYLIQYQLLKRKKGFQWIWRFTNLKKLDTYSFTAVLIGVPLLALGLMLGFIWGHMSGSEFYWLDMKTIGSMILLGIYIVYLILRLAPGYSGKPISIYNSATFLVLLTNFFLFNLLSNFHF